MKLWDYLEMMIDYHYTELLQDYQDIKISIWYPLFFRYDVIISLNLLLIRLSENNDCHNKETNNLWLNDNNLISMLFEALHHE